MRWGPVLSAGEFLALCARVKRAGLYIRHCRPVRGGYQVGGIYPLRTKSEVQSLRSEVRGRRRCAADVAQLWFEVLKAV